MKAGGNAVILTGKSSSDNTSRTQIKFYISLEVSARVNVSHKIKVKFISFSTHDHDRLQLFIPVNILYLK